MSEPSARARFVPQSGSLRGQEIPVHFNPATLQYTVTNTLKEEGSGNQKKQHVSQSTAKLTMDLIYDSTPTGADVRLETSKLARLMQPDAQDNNSPSIALFEWGAYSFMGMVESYKETIDFFSSDGVPLRASVNLTLAQQDTVFEPGSNRRASVAPTVELPRREGDSMSDLASRGGDPNAGRNLGALNNEESLRFPKNPMQTASDGARLAPPAAFASGAAGAGASAAFGAGTSAGFGAGASAGFGAGASAGFGASASAGFGAGASAGFGASASAGLGASASAGVGASASAGFGASAGASFGASASASFGASASAGFGASASAGFSARSSASAQLGISASAGASFGASASRGVTASAGAFAGLRTPVRSSVSTFSTRSLVQRTESVSLATDTGASFRLGGRASAGGSASLRTDVGASADLRARIRFEV